MGVTAMKLLVTNRASSNNVAILLFNRLNTNHRDFIGVSVQWLQIPLDGRVVARASGLLL
jgi:hypothetical protein